MDLTQTIDRFLDERLERRRMSLRQATRCRLRLVGDSCALCLPPGYVQFLKAMGVDKPTLDQLNDHYVGRYFEYLMQRHGGLRASRAMRTLRLFWQ